MLTAEKNIQFVKSDIIKEIEKRVEDKILEPANAELLKKLINNAETTTEAIEIAKLGTIYKRTGFNFDTKCEKSDNTIKYFKKNTELSFETNPNGITHKLIIGDNYTALLNLLIEYKGKIDVIYIDPPYGKDSMGEFAQTNYENAITRDNLLSMLYNRLRIAKLLLSETGVIFCSIDDRNQAYVKCLFDEVFDEKNFICNFNWETTKAAQGMIRKNMVVENHEYILCYQKDFDFMFKGLKRSESNGFSNPDNDPRGVWKRQYLQRIGQGFPIRTIVDPITNISYSFETPYTEEKMNNWIKDNRIIFPLQKDKYPARKEFLSEYKTDKQLITSLGLYATKSSTEKLYSIFNDKKIFSNPKPNDLIKFLLSQSTNNDSIILDFFAGSGTTGQAVLELNKEDNGQRQFILVQLNEDLDNALKEQPKSETIKSQIELCDKYKRPHYLSEITAERLRRVMMGKCYDGSSDFTWIKDNGPLGDNLDVYDIGEVANNETSEGKTPFDVINEVLYGKEKLNVSEKIQWVIENFEITQKRLSDKD